MNVNFLIYPIKFDKAIMKSMSFINYADILKSNHRQ